MDAKTFSRFPSNYECGRKKCGENPPLTGNVQGFLELHIWTPFFFIWGLGFVLAGFLPDESLFESINYSVPKKARYFQHRIPKNSNNTGLDEQIDTK